MGESEDAWTETLTALLGRAEAGDKTAAEEALLHAALSLSMSDRHPTTGQSLPVPEVLREYLSRAFFRMVADLKPGRADRALHLSKAGPAPWAFMDKLAGAYAVSQAMKAAGLSAEQAAAEVAEAFLTRQRERRKSRRQVPPLGGRTANADTLRAWYFELKDELRRREL